MLLAELTTRQVTTLRGHLFDGEVEQVAFGFADWKPAENGGVLRVATLELVPPEGFAFQSAYHIELAHETHAKAIKTAFDAQLCLIEFHSHRSESPAHFSTSDLFGFEEFVPHVQWRLPGRPYAAIVYHERSFDGLVWFERSPVQLIGMRLGGKAIQQATGLTLRERGTPV